jgi:xanthine dehydrogenase accessory factor
MMTDIYAKIEEIKRTGKNATLCIITATTGSTPRKAGSKMIVSGEGETYGTVGGGSVERKIMALAQEVSRQINPKFVSLDLEDDAEMHCGGTVDVYLEPIRPSQTVVILGVGHVGSAIAGFAQQLGFAVTLIDPREEFVGAFSDGAYEIIMDDYLSAIKNYHSNENTYFVITTPKHEFDQELTAICAKMPHRYLGMIGSRKKVAIAKKHYLENNILTPEEIENIDMPIGIKFNAQTPEEIAISIVAKLIDVKNRQEGD